MEQTIKHIEEQIKTFTKLEEQSNRHFNHSRAHKFASIKHEFETLINWIKENESRHKS